MTTTTQRVDDLYARLQPGALQEYRQYMLTRTLPRWQTQMAAYIDLTGALDNTLTAYERQYVREFYLYMRDDAEASYYQFILSQTPWDLASSMDTKVNVNSPFDAYLYGEAVINDGGTMSPARLAVVQSFIAAEKNLLIWDQVDDYWVLAAENESQALISLKRNVRCTKVGTPVFTIDRGYTFSGVSGNALNTNFNPSRDGKAMLVANSRLAVYERTDAGAYSAIGSIGGGNNNLVLRPRSAANTVSVFAVSDACTFTLASNDSRGFTSGSRASSTYGCYKNGVALPILLPSSIGNALPNADLFIGAQTATSGNRASQIAFAVAGKALTGVRETSEYDAVQAWMTAIGAAV